MKLLVSLLVAAFSLTLCAQSNSERERNIAEIERQLIEKKKIMSDPWDSSVWDELKSLLIKYPEETYKHDFDKLISKLDLWYNESKDGIIKCYSFFGGAEMSECVVQYMCNGHFYSIDGGSNYYISMDKVSNNVYLCCEMPWRRWNSNMCYSLEIIELGESIRVLDNLSVCVDFTDMMRRAPNDNNDEFFSYKVDTVSFSSFIIHVPVTISDNNKEVEHPYTDNVLTGQYDAYIIDNNKFKFYEHEGDPFVHESLKRYYRLKTTYLTKRYMLRVDDMGDGKYRYASWNLPNKKEYTPSIIVYGGVYEKERERFKFENEGYVYYVGNGPSDSNRYVEVWKDNKRLLRDIPSK